MSIRRKRGETEELKKNKELYNFVLSAYSEEHSYDTVNHFPHIRDKRKTVDEVLGTEYHEDPQQHALRVEAEMEKRIKDDHQKWFDTGRYDEENEREEQAPSPSEADERPEISMEFVFDDRIRPDEMLEPGEEKGL